MLLNLKEVFAEIPVFCYVRGDPGTDVAGGPQAVTDRSQGGPVGTAWNFGGPPAPARPLKGLGGPWDGRASQGNLEGHRVPSLEV